MGWSDIRLPRDDDVVAVVIIVVVRPLLNMASQAASTLLIKSALTLERKEIARQNDMPPADGSLTGHIDGVTT